MAFLTLLIKGDTSFGGYISMDGEEPVAIQDDVAYQIENGKHGFDVLRSADFELGGWHEDCQLGERDNVIIRLLSWMTRNMTEWSVCLRYPAQTKSRLFGVLY